MNNDVANLNNISAQNIASSNAIEKSAAQKTSNPIENSVKKSVEEFILNPEYVEAHIELCDEFTKKGYCLKDAIDKTDSIFEALKDKETYN
ncbi:MAG: hypothetical protein E7Z88_02715 [Cyanobacteria bacterium SIG27]|nr:hypothetical protein [Cyanobacteria bacterium SIG27]